MAGKRRKAPETPPASEVVDDDPIGANAPETEAERALRIDREAAEAAEDEEAREGAERAEGLDDEDETDDEDDAKGEDGAAVEAAKPPAAPPAPAAPKPPADKPGPKGERHDDFRARIGEPPTTGAKLDPKTGRVEVPAPGTFDAKRRAPQRP